MNKFDFLKGYTKYSRLNVIKQYFLRSNRNKKDLDYLKENIVELIDSMISIDKSFPMSFIALLPNEIKDMPTLKNKIKESIKNNALELDSQELLYYNKTDYDYFKELVNISIKNNYPKTINKLGELIKHGKRSELIELLNNNVKRGYVLNIKDFGLFEIDSLVLKESLKTNTILTLENLISGFESSDKTLNINSSINTYINSIKYIKFNPWKYKELFRINDKFIYHCLKYDPINTISSLLFLKDEKIDDFLRSEDFLIALENNKSFYLNNELKNKLMRVMGANYADKLLNISLNNNFLKTLNINEMGLNIKKDEFIKEIMNPKKEFINNPIAKAKITDIFNSYPKMVDEIFNIDRNRAYKVVCYLSVSKESEELKNIIKKNLIKDKYLVGYFNNNPYLAEYMFFESLKNSYQDTMSFNIKDSFNINEFCKDQLDNYGNELKEVLIKGARESKYEFSKNLYPFFKQDPSILIDLFTLDYQDTLTKLNNGNDYRGFIDIVNHQDSKKLLDILIKNNFKLDNINYRLYYISPIFLIASLKNDYSSTKDLVLDKLSMTDFNINSYEMETLINILKENKDSKFPFELGVRNINLFKKLINKNPKIALELIKDLKSINPLNKTDALDVLNSIKDTDFTFKDNPNLVCLLARSLMIDTLDTDYPKIKKTLLEHNFPKTFLSFENDEELYTYLANQTEIDLYNDINENEFSLELEKRLLTYLNTDSKTIEQEVVKMEKKGLKRADLSLIEMLTFVLYTKKLAKEKGINLNEVSPYDYQPSPRNLGTFTHGKEILYMANGHNVDIYLLIEIINHEMNHARQALDVKNLDFDSDQDIIAYSKELLIRKLSMACYGYNYYGDNYSNFLVEFDAEFKALAETNKLFNKDSMGNVVNLNDFEGFLNNIVNQNQYSYNPIRTFDKKTYFINDLLEMLLQSANKQEVYTIDDFYTENKIIKAEYKFNDNGEIVKLTNKEILDRYLISNDRLYLKILDNRMDHRYDSNSNKNIEEIKELIKDKNLAEIEKIIENQQRKYKIFLTSESLYNKEHLFKYYNIADLAFKELSLNKENKKR